MNGHIPTTEEMKTAAMMLAAGGLKPRDIAQALRVDLAQVLSWLGPTRETVDGAR